MFNLKPMLSDICAIRSTVSNIKKEVQKLLDNEGKPRHLHWRCPISGIVSSDEITEPSSNIPSYMRGKVSFRRIVNVGEATFNATIELSYKLDAWQRQNALLGGYLDALGVSVNPQVLWNAIPWSFVVDWVVDIGQFLSQFNRRTLEPTTVIRRFIVSQTVSRSVRTYHKFGIDSPWGSSGDVPSIDITEKAYIRSLMDADVIRWFRTSGLSSTEVSLASALLASRA
jgi:hypothetical protein